MYQGGNAVVSKTEVKDEDTSGTLHVSFFGLYELTRARTSSIE